jgi:hypothetical protein
MGDEAETQDAALASSNRLTVLFDLRTGFSDYTPFDDALC